jgi:hypothetical protein
MAKHTVKIRCYLNIIDEEIAGGAITPGMLVSKNSDDEIVAHATAAGTAIPKFALEDDLQGKGIDDAYAEGDKAQCWTPTRGDRVYALLKAESAAVAIGDFLESAGDGTLQKFSAIDAKPNQIVAIAKEAVTPGTANARIIVEIV